MVCAEHHPEQRTCQPSDSCVRLVNQFAHLDESGNLTALAAPSSSSREDQPAIDHSRHGRNSIGWIEQSARKLQRELWQRRAELWPDGVPSDPAKLLDPEVAFRLIGFHYELAETLGQFSNENGTFEVAGIIDRPSRRVQNSRQLPLETRAFTAAHELGHALLHEGIRMHRDRPLDGSQQERSRRDRVEFEADKFASFFLMPEKLLRARFHQLFLCGSLVIDDATALSTVE